MNLHSIPREVTTPVLPIWMYDGIRSWLAQSNGHNVRIHIPSLRAELSSMSGIWMSWPEDSIRSWTLPQYFIDAPFDWGRVEIVND